MASFHEIILNTIGDGDDARHDLEKTGAELTRFDGLDAEATLELATKEFKAELQAAKAELKALGTESASPDVDLDTAGAKAHIREIEAQLAILGARDVNVDVNVDRDGAARSGLRGLVDLGKQAWDALGNLLSDGAQNAGSSLVGMGGSAGSSGGQLSILASVAGEVAAVAGIAMVAAIGSAVVALIALASSAIAAAAALGALAVAGLALVAPFAGLIIGAIARFKDEADQAGTAANRLKTIAGQLGSVFKATLGPAADAVFRGLATGLAALLPTIRSLGPSFTQFGRIAGDSLRNLLFMFASPVWANFFRFLIRSASAVLPALVTSFSFLFTIMRNIATAAMPFLIAGLRSLSGFLGKIGAATGNVGVLRGQIGGLVTHLQAWLALAGQLGRIFFGVIKAAAPAGLELVKWLTQGAQSIADWVNSAQGSERIKQFFSDTLPLVKEMVTFFARLAVVGAELFQAIAPSLAFIFSGINLLLQPVIFLLDLFNRIPASVRSWIIPFGAVIGLVTTLIGVVQSFGAVWAFVAGAATAAFNAIRSAVTTVVGGAFNWVASLAAARFADARAVAQSVAAAISSIVSAGRAAWGWIRDRASEIAGAVRGIAQGLAGAVGGIVSRAVGSAWHWVSDAMQAVAGVVRGLISGLVGWVKERINDAITVMHDLAAVVDAVKSKIDGLLGSIGSAISKVGDLADKVTSLPGKALGLLASGTTNWPGGWAITGEEGPELINLPSGSDVFKASDTARMLAQLAGGPPLPGLAQGTASPGPARSGSQLITNQIFAPAGEQPDAETTLALIDMKIRRRGLG